MKYCEVETELKIFETNASASAYLTSSMDDVTDTHIRVALVGETMTDPISEDNVFAYLYLYGFRFPKNSSDGVDLGTEMFKNFDGTVKSFPQPTSGYPWRTQSWMQDANGNANIYQGNTGYPFFQFTLAQIVNGQTVNSLPDNFDNGYDTGGTSNNAFKYDVYGTWKYPSYITTPNGGPLYPFVPVAPFSNISRELNFSSNTFISTALPIEKVDKTKRIVLIKPPFPHLNSSTEDAFPFGNWDNSRNSNHRGIIAGYHLMGPLFKNLSTIGNGLDSISTGTCRLYYMESMDEIDLETSQNLQNGMNKGETSSTLVESCWYYFDATSAYKLDTGTGDNNINGSPVGYSSEFLWLNSFFSADTYEDPTQGIESTNILATLTNPNFNLPFVPIPNTLNEFYFRTEGNFLSPPRYEILNGEYELAKVTTVTGDSVMYVGISSVTGIFSNPLTVTL